MHPSPRRNRRRPDHRTATGPLADFFETFVSVNVEGGEERRVQACVIAALVGVGLLAATLSPLAVVAALPLGLVLLPIVASALALGSAAALSATGRLDALLAAAAAVAMLFALVATLADEAAAAGAALALSLPPAVAATLRRSHRRQSVDRTGVRERVAVEEAVTTRLAGPMLRFDPAGRLLSAPAGCADLFGEIPAGGIAFVERVHLLDRMRFLDAFADLRRGRDVAELELRVAASDGEHVVALRLAAEAGRGSVVDILGILRDLTAERDVARRLALDLSRVEDASDAKSRFLAAISHELRTPLNAIIGFTEILDQEFFGGFETPRQKEYVNLIKGSGEHLLQVVNGLLDISKIEAGRYEIVPERFCAIEAIEAAAAMVRGEAERKGLVLIVQEPADRFEVRADRRALHQVLLNLLSNAVKFTDRGTVRISVRLEGEWQIVDVEDTGIGIAPFDLQRVAQPFVRLAGVETRPGTGLGLSVARGLCELHGGTLGVDSRLGIGTTATVAIPFGCLGRGSGEGNLKEKIVSLDDARKKNASEEDPSAGRRLA